MFALVDAIATAIENRVITERYATAIKGESIVTVEDVRGYTVGDSIVIHEADVAELHTIDCIDGQELHLAEPIATAFTALAKVQKAHDRNMITTVHRGEPPSIPIYPAITVELAERVREPLTLEDVEDDYGAIIRTYVDVTSDYESQYALLLDLTHKVENGLFIPLYLRIPPYFQTILDEPIEANDTLIKTVDAVPAAGQIIIEDGSRSRIRTLVDGLGNNVYELNYALPAFPVAGTTVTQLLVHSYNPEVLATDYGNATDGDRMLRYSEIFYSVSILRQRNKTVVL